MPEEDLPVVMLFWPIPPPLAFVHSDAVLGVVGSFGETGGGEAFPPLKMAGLNCALLSK